MAKITAPFTDEQVTKLIQWQSGWRDQQTDDIIGPVLELLLPEGKMPAHPFTCCGHDGCIRSEQLNDRILSIHKEGFICPCGKYEQDWCHDFMVE